MSEIEGEVWESVEEIQFSDEIERLKRKVREQLVEISELHKKNTCIYQEIGILQQRICELESSVQIERSEKEQLQGTLLKTTNAYRSQTKILDEVNSEHERIQKSLAQSDAKIKCLEDQLNQIYSSKSWKITKPLRNLLWKVR